MSLKVSNRKVVQIKKCLACTPDPPTQKKEVIKKLAFDFCRLDESDLIDDLLQAKRKKPYPLLEPELWWVSPHQTLRLWTPRRTAVLGKTSGLIRELKKFRDNSPMKKVMKTRPLGERPNRFVSLMEGQLSDFVPPHPKAILQLPPWLPEHH